MSILLIGQRNRYYSSQKPKFLDKEEVEEHKRAKKNIQDQYRRELIEQMQESHDRRKKQKQREKEIDMKYEKLFYEQLAEHQHRPHIDHINQNSANRADSQQVGISFNYLKPHRKQNEITLPPVFKDQTQKKNKFSRLETEPIYQSFHTKPAERVQTDFQKYDEYAARSDDKLQSVQVRQRKLQEQLQNKLKEVYQLMAHSVKSFNQSQELQKIGNKLSPIKLNLEKQYKVKYHSPKPQSYNDEKDDYYKLPNITHGFKQETFTTPVTQTTTPYPKHESEADWREWYAKQKLRELQARYKKQLDVEASQLKYYKRAATPKFKTEMDEY